jgi:hypothetical protein
VRAAVETLRGVAVVDLDEDEILELDEDASLEPPTLQLSLPLVVAADRSGPFIVAVVARKPPLVVSRDAGTTWHETGHGLPAGAAVSISPDHPDLVLFASDTRLYVSRDGGRFWHPLAVELPGIRALEWLED